MKCNLIFDRTHMHASIFLAYNILKPRRVEELERVVDKLKPYLLGEMPLETDLF